AGRALPGIRPAAAGVPPLQRRTVRARRGAADARAAGPAVSPGAGGSGPVPVRPAAPLLHRSLLVCELSGRAEHGPVSPGTLCRPEGGPRYALDGLERA